MSMDFSSDSVIKFIIGSSRIKYDILNQLFKNIWITDQTIVMHVDAHAILYRLYREKYLDPLYSVQYDVLIKDIVIEFLNVIGHYRRYIATRLHKTNNIIIYYNTKQSYYHHSICDDYLSSYYKMIDLNHKDYGPITQVIIDSIKFIEGIVPYFEGIYLVDNSNIDTYTAICYCMQLPIFNSQCFHIIFSQNQLTFQLLNDHCVQIINHKDKSKLVTADNYLNDILLENHKRKIDTVIKPRIMPLIWTLCGCHSVDLKHTKYIRGIARTFFWLLPLIKDHTIYEDMSIQSFLKAVSTLVDDGKLELVHPTSKLLNRYRVLELSLSVAALTDDQKIKIQKNFIDLYDQSMLEEMNELISGISSFGSLIDINNLNMATVEQDVNEAEFYYNHIELFL